MKERELTQVGQQLRNHLAQKSIKKLSEVIGIKSVLTAMNLETDSSGDETQPPNVEKETQTEGVQVCYAECQTSPVEEEAKVELVQAVSTPKRKIRPQDLKQGSNIPSDDKSGQR